MKKLVIPGFFVVFTLFSIICFNLGAAATVFNEKKFVVREGKDKMSYSKVELLGQNVDPTLNYFHVYTVKEVYSRSGITYKVTRDTLTSSYVTAKK